MAYVWCLACGLLCATCALVLTRGQEGRGGAGPGAQGAIGPAVSVRLQALRRRVAWVLAVTGSSRLCELLLRWPAFAHTAHEVSKACATRGVEVDRGTGAALIAYATVALAIWVSVSMGAVAAGMVVAVVAATMYLRLSSAERARRHEVSQSMPSVFRTLATALSAGQTLVQALDYVGLHERGPAGEVFARASLRLRCGMSSEQALRLLQDELDAPGVGLMACALAISQRTGSPLRDLFQRSAVLVEQQGDLERMLAVRTAQVRLSVRVVCGLPPLMVFLLALISPDYRLGLASAAGVVCLSLAVALDAAALIAIRKIMKGVLA